ncbi:MAG TPA: ABC transporter substrate-binding protein [Stackebrandtia sp.]|uniref:ABC transporter substrate-binding protein n=1 Tax=Stackebrandtia sp. TaxID=2023065 RepID=UPI002D5D99BF|nr:ABC transporter substrate-binding protein [Stackebrandtia sp.]HZE37175.1 ABC transporter substrate-binding protein [Stackebrandtia sp.]
MIGALAGCTASKTEDTEKVDIGLLMPLTGAYAPPGKDMKDAVELYLDLHHNKLGGRDVDVHYGDEGDSPKTSVPEAKRLLNKYKVDVMAGAASSANYAAVAPETVKHEIPFIGIGGQPDLKQMGLDNEWLWQAAVLPDRSGVAMAPYIASHVKGPVYAIGPDYVGGYAIVGGFVKPFLKAGGQLANPSGQPTWTPWPKTKDYSKYFQEIAQSNAKAIYSFYLGQPAVDFVKQYAKSEVKDIPMYSSFLTEGPSLEAEGASAKGIYTAMNYSPDIDNAANRRFVSDWSNKYPDRQTNFYSLDGWDTVHILDQAIGRIDKDKKVTGATINEALGHLGTIDSPRGTWQFSEKTHAPVQKWYLRQVAGDGPSLSNVVIQELATLDG